MDALLAYVFGGLGTALAGLAFMAVIFAIDRLLAWVRGGKP